MSTLQELRQDVRQAVAHDRAADKHDDKIIEQKKAAGASLFAAIKKAAHLAGIETPPEDPKKFAAWRRNVGTDKAIPAYVAAVKEEGPYGDPLQWARYIVQWHTDPDVAAAAYTRKLADKRQRAISHKQKQEKQGATSMHRGASKSDAPAVSENVVPRFTRGDEQRAGVNAAPKPARRNVLPEALEAHRKVGSLLKRAPGYAVEDALATLQQLAAELEDAIYQVRSAA